MNREIIKTSLGNFIVIEILDYFDEPLLFSCADQTGRLFLAIVIDEIENINKWIFVPISLERLNEVKRGFIPLREAFAFPEVEWLIDIYGSIFTGKEISARFIHKSDILPEWLPDEDICLETIDDNYYLANENDSEIFKDKELYFIADESQLETLEVSLQTPAHIPKGIIPMELLGNFLSRTQSLFFSIVSPARGRKPDYVKLNSGLNVLPRFSEGSFIIRLQQNKVDDIFNENFLGELSLPAFFKLLKAADDKKSLLEIVNSVELASIIQYNKLLRVLSSGDCGIKCKWVSPKLQKTEASLTPTQVRSIITLLNQENELTTKTFNAIGELVMAHSKKHKFELYAYDGREYKGTVDSRLYNHRFEVASYVEATIEETIKLNTISEKTTYRLMSVKALSNEEYLSLLSSEEE